MSGGVALFWDADVQLEIMCYSSHHIDAVVHNGSGKKIGWVVLLSLVVLLRFQ